MKVGEHLFTKPRSKCLWFSYKDDTRPKGKQHVHKSTGTADQAEGEKRRALFLADLAAAETAGASLAPLTVRQYIERWLKDREERGIASAKQDRQRLEDFAVPYIGSMPIAEVSPKHVRDLARTLRGLKKPDGDPYAPRSIIHVIRTLHNVFENAEVDEHVIKNPVKLKRGELPAKLDADPEWRSLATYTVREVERLISDTKIPVERRVQYALKSIAGMRHGEMAALCWRHLDYDAEPLARINIVQAFCTRTHKVKSTKTGQSRQVPMHPTLAKILAAWKLEHWERIYGRKPTADDFVVPTRQFTCVNGTDACRAMNDDLLALGLRVEAGKKRTRQGHDLRAWYQTRCIEDGADSALIRRTTHAPDKSVNGGYERFSWATLCREVAKLTVTVLDGKVLHFVQASVQAEKRAQNRWRSRMVTP